MGKIEKEEETTLGGVGRLEWALTWGLAEDRGRARWMESTREDGAGCEKRRVTREDWREGERGRDMRREAIDDGHVERFDLGEW